MLTVLAFLTAFAITTLTLPLVRRLAFKVGALDYPGGRKIHEQATPLLGGIAIYLGLLSSVVVERGLLNALSPFFLGATAIFALGLAEDIWGVSAQSRFLVQVGVSLVLISMGMRVSFLPPGLLGDAGEVIITVLWIVGVTNAYNYLDGLDGLAAGSAVINFFFFFLILYATGQYQIGFACMAMAAACLAFLPFNFSRSKIFLGEAGSTLLGFSLAAVSLTGSWSRDNNPFQVLIPVLVLGVPIFDMIFTTIMRIKEGKVKTIIQWLRYGGTDHFHHYLVDLGLNPRRAVYFIYSVTFFLGIGAILLSNDDYVTQAILSLVQASIIFGGIATLIVVGKRRRSGWEK